MNRMQDQVTEFHRKFAHPIGESPAFRRPELRAKLILEEAVETVAGIVGGHAAFELLTKERVDLVSRPPMKPDFVEAIDGICDLLYVAFGAAIEFGVDIQPIFDEVHRSNMAKVGGATRADGKTLKPPGWQPPRVAEMIEAQRKAVYVCDHCGVASPKDQWGPGRVVCPACKRHAKAASESAT